MVSHYSGLVDPYRSDFGRSLGGGGVSGVLPDLSQLLAQYTSRSLETPNIDQWFLRDRVWRYLKQSCLIHDRCFHQAGSIPMPGPLPQGLFHVGCCEAAQRPEFQRKILSAWIEGKDWM